MGRRCGSNQFPEDKRIKEKRKLSEEERIKEYRKF